jgi:protein gp37
LIPDDFIARVFAVMADCPQVTFQVLTKRPERAAHWGGPWPENIWMGTSVEDARVVHRVDSLRGCAAQTRFLSCEPLIGPLGSVGLTGIHWVIVGGESGPGYRPMDHAWARQIRDACIEQGTGFFFKQSSAFRTEVGTALEHEDGSKWIWQQYPRNLTPARMIA